MIPYGQKDFPHQVRPQADPYDTHKELTAMNIQTACAADTAKIYRIMTEARSLAPDSVAREIPLFAQVKQWLALYFAGQEPELEIPIHMVGTAFQKAVWRILRTIPYGQTMTYGAIARQVAEELGIRRMSPQAVGGAVGHNPISILIPCHRVVGTGGSLTGYAGGLDKKIWLLKHEGVKMDGLTVPARGTAL